MAVQTEAQPSEREAALKNLLEDRRREIVVKLRALREVAAPEATIPKDLEDHAVDDLVRHMEFALAEMRSATLHKIEEALRRLNDGSYGACADCRAHIPEARLAALPFASLCQRCQTERETGGWLAGPFEEAVATHSRAI